MPRFATYTKHQLKGYLAQLHENMYTTVGKLDIEGWTTKEPVSFADRKTGEHKKFAPGDKWGDLFDCAWFHFTGTIPQSAAGRNVVVMLDFNGELCIVDEQGDPVRGLTGVVSGPWLSPGKRVFEIAMPADGGEPIDFWADAGANDLFGVLRGEGKIDQADIAVCNTELRALFYDFQVLHSLFESLPEETARSRQVHRALCDAAHVLRDFTEEEAAEAREILKPQLEKKGGDPSLSVSAVGHSHLDLAWLWPVRETYRKGARTFATVLYLMDRYEDYVYGSSQPQLFQWMKEKYPNLYARMQERIKEGRFEAQGAMWVEADTNVSGGEALVRQILQGKRFFRDEFDVDVDYLWLPDVFGYSAALPQILKKSGVDYFMTQKLSWSKINSFPHQSFHWQGIDGTEVLSHMLPEENYNSTALPGTVTRIEKNYKDKDVSSHAMMLFGIGDGGGGPGAEHLERLDRIKNLSGICPVKQEPAAEFFKKFVTEADRFPRWVGELYLEFHQGTFTTQARNKWYNRKLEQALRNWEISSIVVSVLDDADYPCDRLRDIWREMLFFQFHDVLPGSSIKRVYDESLERYAAMYEEVNSGIKANLECLASKIDTSDKEKPVVVVNPMSWQRTEWLKLADRWQQVTVPSMGYAAVDAAKEAEVPAVKASENELENDLLRVQFAADGSIVSVYDKEADREALREPANRLAVYYDPGDAWDFPMDYAERAPRYMELQTASANVDGPKAIIEQVYTIGHSEVVQTIVLTANSRRLDFNTKINHWRERASMLRTSFPVALNATDATCEIQYGSIKRPTHDNTTWDMAKNEVPAHKYVDLSQRDYGVALLNDSKYGHKVKGNTLDLNLLRSARYPHKTTDEEAEPDQPDHNYTDQADHQLTYALYPHQGDHVAGGVVRAGYELNFPLGVVTAESHEGPLPAEVSFLSVDKPNVIIEVVKKAEDSGDAIIRLYEAEATAVTATLTFGGPFAGHVTSVEETDLMEENAHPIDFEGDSVKLQFTPFEIKTLRVR